MPNHLPWLAAANLSGIGPITFHRALDYFQTIDAIFSASEKELQIAGLTQKQIHLLKTPDWKTAEANQEWAAKNHCQIISFVDPAYPLLLREIHAAPLILYVQGDADLLQQPQLAIVGSRNPTITGSELAEKFAAELASANLVITSGLALGVDAASHQGALASTGKTIAVLGTGLAHIYPRSHQKLAEAIKSKGALVSEFAPNTLPKAPHFPMRNRIISGLSLGVLVVEAAIRSGSLITARLASEQNREVFAIPGSIHNPLARGCHQLIRQGAKLVETAEDILEELGALYAAILPKTQALSNKEPVDLDPQMQRVLAKIGYEVTSLDVIITRSRLTAGLVSSMLLSLELKGYVQAVPGGYQRTRTATI
ncbi:MAG: DNA-processing protein DprA [Gammaproteobacteria bacterium]